MHQTSLLSLLQFYSLCNLTFTFECNYNAVINEKAPTLTRANRGDGKPARFSMHHSKAKHGGKDMEDMGYQNTQALYDLNRTGRLAKKRGDNLT